MVPLACRLSPVRIAPLTRVVVTAVLAAFLLVASEAALSAQSASEVDVKAAFLYNFTKFVEWPPSAFAAADDPFRICVIARQEFVTALDTIISGESVKGRPMQRVVPGPDDVPHCQILFVGAEESGRAVRLLSLVGRAPVLTVGDGPAFLAAGGAVAFAMDNGRVRFDVDLRSATRAGLVVSSKLLRVARNVREDTR